MSDPKYEKIGDPITNLIEECAELIHILCKAQRFGLKTWHPDDKEKTTNYELIRREMVDVEKRTKEFLKWSKEWAGQ